MGRRRKQKSKRVPKESRKSLKFWAEGARETILLPYIDEYSKALDDGWRSERKCLQRICNEFHARVDWKIQDHEEPTLADYDPKQMIIAEELPEEDEIRKRTRIDVLNAVSLDCDTVTLLLIVSASVFVGGTSTASANPASTAYLRPSTPRRIPMPFSSANSLESPRRRKPDRLTSNSWWNRTQTRSPLWWPKSGL